MSNGNISEDQKAQREFDVIQDLLLAPLKQDVSSKELPPHRRWKGGCLLSPAPKPDLVPINPIPNLGEIGFCPGAEPGVFKVTVENRGDAKAPVSVTRVDFLTGQKKSLDLTTQEIAAGQTFDHIVNIPPECFDQNGECRFKITVNADNKVDEYYKSNNTISGKCFRITPE